MLLVGGQSELCYNCVSDPSHQSPPCPAIISSIQTRYCLFLSKARPDQGGNEKLECLQPSPLPPGHHIRQTGEAGEAGEG